MLIEVVTAAKAFMAHELGLETTVVAVDRSDTGWVAQVEAVLVDHEMRRLAKRDLVATFELTMDKRARVLSFARKAMRERGSVSP